MPHIEVATDYKITNNSRCYLSTSETVPLLKRSWIGDRFFSLSLNSLIKLSESSPLLAEQLCWGRRVSRRMKEDYLLLPGLAIHLLLMNRLNREQLSYKDSQSTGKAPAYAMHASQEFYQSTNNKEA